MIQMLSSYLESYTARFRSEEGGQGLVEYALIIALVSVVMIVAVKALGAHLDGVFTRVGDSLADAGST